MTFDEIREDQKFIESMVGYHIDSYINGIKNNFKKVVETNQKLREENTKLRDEHYKDEELSKLKCELTTIRTNNEFLLTDEEAKKRYEFMEHLKTCERYKKLGTYSYEVCPTPIGKAVDLICCCGHGIELIKL